MGTPEQNKALVMCFIDCLDGGDVAGAAACFDADRYYSHPHGVTSTRSGTFLGVPATGRRVTFDEIEIWRIENDKIVEHWGGLAETERLYELVRGDD